MTYVGVDLGSDSVKVVALRQAANGLVLHGIGLAPTPEGALEEGRVLAGKPLSQALKRALRQAGVRRPTAVIAVTGQGVAAKRISLPRMGPKETAAALGWEAKGEFPYIHGELVMDYGVVSDGEGERELLWVVADKELVLEHLAIAQMAGVHVDVVDLFSLALVGLAPQDDQVRALVDIGAQLTHLVLARGQTALFQKVMPMGGAQFAQGLAQALEISMEEAEGLIKNQGLGHEQMVQVLTPWAAEIRRSLDLFEVRGEQVSGILLSGGSAAMPELCTWLSGVLERTVGPLDLWAWVEVPQGMQLEVGGFAGQLAGALALALRGVAQDD